MKTDIFHNEKGFSSFGMVVALLVTISLLFTSAQVYKINTQSAQTQEIADACAVAAENQVAEFMIAVQVCDALVLSLSLTSISLYGIGIVALCVPGTNALAPPLIQAASKVLEARNKFAKTAAQALNATQKALPALASLAAMDLAIANNKNASLGANYYALACLEPLEGEEISVGALDENKELDASISETEEEIKKAAQEAEDAARTANEIKEKAFMADCGNSPEYCMYERASKLAHLEGISNPHFSSVDTWSFEVALLRAKAYYKARLAKESPASSSVEEQAKSALRKNFYTYANQEMQNAYVEETDTSFKANFPLLPKNLTEMRSTPLYTDAIYPVSNNGNESIMHAWDGCPNADEIVSRESIARLEKGGFTECDACHFSETSLGQIGQASTYISNGFEYHYNIVAAAAADYQKAKEAQEPASKKVKDASQSLFDECKDLASSAIGMRIYAKPPGYLGAVAVVVNTANASTDKNIESSFITKQFSLGVQVAVSGATLLEDNAEDGKNILSSFFDNLASSGNAAGSAGKIICGIWGTMLQVYSDGQKALTEALNSADKNLKNTSASGLGSWAAKALSDTLETLGLEPAQLSAPKAVIVNSEYVAQSETSTFTQTYMKLKKGSSYIEEFTQTMYQLSESIDETALDVLDIKDSKIKIADIELPFLSHAIEVKIPVPESITNGILSLITSLQAGIRNIESALGGGRVWR